MYAVAGNVSLGAGYSGDSGPATLAALAAPFGVAVALDYTLYIADTYNNVVRALDTRYGIIRTVAGTYYKRGVAAGGATTPPRYSNSAPVYFSNPTGLAVDLVDGAVYVADAANNVVRKLNPATGAVSTYAGVFGSGGYSGDNGPAAAASFNYPSALALGPDRSLYIADTNNSVIRCINKTTGVVTTVAGKSSLGRSFSGDGLLATLVGLNAPSGGERRELTAPTVA